MQAALIPTLDDQVHTDTGELVARVGLGLTAYLADGRAWAENGASARAVQAFLDVAPVDQLQVYTTSLMTAWQAAPPAARLTEALAAEGWLATRCRPFFNLRVADSADAPSVGLSYTEVDSLRSSRAGVLEFTLPIDGDPAVLLRLATALCALGPVHAMVGGYALRWNIRYQRIAFSQFYRWAQRFVGIDAQDAEASAWRVPEGLTSSSWLTVLGSSLLNARKFDMEALAKQRLKHRVTVTRAEGPGGGAWIVKAGNTPTVGDRHGLTLPLAYMESARVLADLYLDEPEEFWGPFTTLACTKAWQRRLCEPKGWP